MRDEQATEELLGAYALSACLPEDRVPVETLLASSPEARAEVDGYFELLVELAPEEEPPPALWTRLREAMDAPPLRVVDAVQPATHQPGTAQPVSTQPAPSRTARTTAWWSTAVAAAVALVLAVSLGSVMQRNAELQDQVATLSAPSLSDAARAAVADPDSLVVDLSPIEAGAVGTATVAVRPDGTGFLTDSTMPALPADRTYQLWAITDGGVVSAGVLGADPETIAFQIDPAGQLGGLVITEESQGGVVSSSNPALIGWLAEA